MLAASGLPEGEKVSLTFGLTHLSSFLGRSQNSSAEKIMGNELLMLPSSALKTQLSLGNLTHGNGEKKPS